VRARDLDNAGIPRAYLKRLCDRGLLEQVDRGLYRLAAAPVEHEVETRVIDGVKVQLTMLAKTVTDCFRFRRHVIGIAHLVSPGADVLVRVLTTGGLF